MFGFRLRNGEFHNRLFQLENLSHADPPYKLVAALNCVILGCANIWDLDRAYQTFEAISSSFGLAPDVHSYNALMYAFGRLKKVRILGHILSHFHTCSQRDMHFCSPLRFLVSFLCSLPCI